VTAALGLAPRFIQPERFWAGWQKPGQSRPLLLVERPFDGGPAAPGNGQMTALMAPDRAAVDRAYQAALAAGGRDEGAPGLRPQYHAHYYGAYFRDPEGNKLCVVCHEAVG
jgi:lactoylglutathione lyase